MSLLPDHPDLRHLKDEARDLVRAGAAGTRADALHVVAKKYGFASWPRLRDHVDSLQKQGQLRDAIDANYLARVRTLMSAAPDLHRAPLGYAQNGPLTQAAECRGLAAAALGARLEIARWLLDNGSDVHQGGDGPLMRAALRAERISMMELLVSRGADTNALWAGWYPVLWAACETQDQGSLRWLLDHGADPQSPGAAGTALDYLLGGYLRSPRMRECIRALVAAGGTTKYDMPGVMATIMDQPDQLRDELGRDPSLVHRLFPDLDIGSTGARRLVLRGATLLHVAAEFGSLDAARLLLESGAAVDAPAAVDSSGTGGQTPLFHAVSQYDDAGLALARLLLEAGASLAVRAHLPGHHERPDEVVHCTPLGYAARFPGARGATVALLEAAGGVE
jgi:ankyrin repeat protein